MIPIRYTVTATQDAEDDLLALWLNHPAQQVGITNASRNIDSALRNDPLNQGKSSPTPDESDRMSIDRLPLRAYYFVSEPDRQVVIVGYVLLLYP